MAQREDTVMRLQNPVHVLQSCAVLLVWVGACDEEAKPDRLHSPEVAERITSLLRIGNICVTVAKLRWSIYLSAVDFSVHFLALDRLSQDSFYG